jgi:hypothetical protein
MHSIEQSHYFHYGTGKPNRDTSSTAPITTTEPGWNQQQQTEARERIRQAVADLLEKGTLPVGITDRFDALITYGISGSTLYRHRNLWHSRHLQLDDERGELQSDAGQECLVAAPNPDSHINLLEENGCNSSWKGFEGFKLGRNAERRV